MDQSGFDRLEKRSARNLVKFNTDEKTLSQPVHSDLMQPHRLESNSLEEALQWRTWRSCRRKLSWVSCVSLWWWRLTAYFSPSRTVVNRSVGVINSFCSALARPHLSTVSSFELIRISKNLIHWSKPRSYKTVPHWTQEEGMGAGYVDPNYLELFYKTRHCCSIRLERGRNFMFGI